MASRLSRTWKCHRSEEHTSELQLPCNLVCRVLLEKKKNSRFVAGLVTDRVDSARVQLRTACAGRKSQRAEQVVGRQRLRLFFSGLFFFFFNDAATTEISPFSLPDARPI